MNKTIVSQSTSFEVFYNVCDSFTADEVANDLISFEEAVEVAREYCKENKLPLRNISIRHLVYTDYSPFAKKTVASAKQS